MSVPPEGQSYRPELHRCNTAPATEHLLLRFGLAFLAPLGLAGRLLETGTTSSQLVE
jgi:hypothetical protein